MRRCASILLFAALLVPIGLTSACGGNRAYLDWRPGLTDRDFDGVFEISLDELETYADEAAANTRFDRYHGEARPDASQSMAKLGEMLAETASSDPRGYAIVELGGDGRVSLIGNRGSTFTGSVEWLAITPDQRYAALLSETKLAVAIDGASTGIEIGTLVGNNIAGQRVMMIVRDGELSVFVLPELGGVVTANEPGYLFAFRHRPGAAEAWDVSVARVVVVM